MPARKTQFQIWHEQVKRELLITEPQNILARAQCCQNIINECISHMNMNLGLRTLTPMEQHECKVKPTDHLKFLLNWPGLRVDNSPKAPKTKKEYEKKSKNWLNGRRAPNYGKTLFPYFITDCEAFILTIATILIPNNSSKQKLYYDMIMYKILAQLCGCSVSLHEQAKKAPFFCKNSVERKGRLKEMLQSYAPDHEYIQGFPSCFEEAIGYFDRKSNEYFHQYRKQYLGYETMGATTTSNGYDMDDMDSLLSLHEYKHKRSIKTASSLGLNRNRNMNGSNKSYKLNAIHSYKREESSHLHSMQNGSNLINVDAEYWKKQFLNLKRELTNERQIRANVERERDNLKNLINTSTDTTRINFNNFNSNTNASANLSLRNDIHSNQSYDSSISTCSSHYSIPPNNNTNNNNNTLNPINMNRYHSNIPSNNIYQNNEMRMNGINGMNISNGSFVIPHNRPPHMICSSNNNMSGPSLVFQPSLNEIPSNDAFSTIIDTMPIMNKPQISNESYPGFDNHINNINTNTNTNNQTTTPMYSFQNL